jgi:tetratricopeptide (TPR) repeat protein
MVLMRHLPDDSKSRSQYMDLLGVAVQEDPNCHRNAFYYARELGYQARQQECIDAFKRYLSLPGATWDHERCYAHRAIGRSYTALGNHFEAEKSFRLATAEAPYIRESWSELAMFMYQQHRWTECFSNALIGLGITHKEPIHTSDPGVWGYRLHDLAAISAHHLGMPKIAIKHGELALEIEPDDGRLKNNMRFYRDADIAQLDLAAE